MIFCSYCDYHHESGRFLGYALFVSHQGKPPHADADAAIFSNAITVIFKVGVASL